MPSERSQLSNHSSTQESRARLLPPIVFPCLVLTVLALVLGPSRLIGQTEIGGDDVRLSHAGPDGDRNYDAAHEGTAYDESRDRALVVWDADARVPGVGLDTDGKRELFGRLIDGDGTALGQERLLVTLGPATNTRWDARNPEVVYNPERDEFLLVFVGTVSVGTVAVDGVASKNEIFVQRLAADGQPIGSPIRVTQTGSDSDLLRDSREPGIAYNSQDDEYLVVFQYEVSDTGSGAENEIWLQRLGGANARPIGSPRAVSQMGPRGSAAYDAIDPAVAYNRNRNEYLVVWRGDDNRSGLVNGEFEIFGQRIAADGTALGEDDFRISEMGPSRNAGFDAEDPYVVHNPDQDEYLVTWTATDRLQFGDEVYAEILSGSGQTLRPQFRISSMGPEGDASFAVDETEAVYNPGEGEYFVVWMGTDGSAPGVARDGREVYGQRIQVTTGTELGIDDVAISSMGPQGSSRYDAYSIDLLFNSVRNEYLVAWSGDDDRGSLIDDELEIFVQRLTPEVPPCRVDQTTLCLAGGRFQVTANWAIPSGKAGSGKAFDLTEDTGGFWFFDSENVELVVKVLDGRALNGRFWVFFGALSDVAYELTVRDTATGDSKTYLNQQGNLASVGDTSALPSTKRGGSFELRSSPQLEGSVTASPPAADPKAACSAGANRHCLGAGGRFQVEVEWRNANDGSSGAGRATTLTRDSGLFWFFRPDNIELIVKVLDGRTVNGKFWVFFGALSNVEYTVRVTDTETGAVRTYANPFGTFASRADTGAFDG